jgi:hypothetical protein
MRRVISMSMIIIGLWAIATGIWQFFSPYNKGIEPTHIIPAFLFGLLTIAHVWLNRKPVLRYFRGLGFRWIPIGLGDLVVLWASIGLPILLRIS